MFIKTEEEFEKAILRIEELLELGDDENEELYDLSLFVEDYERRTRPDEPLKFDPRVLELMYELEQSDEYPLPYAKTDFMQGYYTGCLDTKIQIGARIRYLYKDVLNDSQIKDR